MTTTAHEDQCAPEPVSGDPVFESRAELEAWVVATLRSCHGKPASHLRLVLDCIRRVTLAHLHLREGEG